jgi:hypothetical protein
MWFNGRILRDVFNIVSNRPYSRSDNRVSLSFSAICVQDGKRKQQAVYEGSSPV